MVARDPKRIIPNFIFLAVACLAISCAGAGFQGGGGGGGAGDGTNGGSGGPGADANPNPNGEGPDGLGRSGGDSGAGTDGSSGTGFPDGGDGRTGLSEGDGSGGERHMVPLTVYYEGDNSGDDAKFTFYLARVSPVRDLQEVEVIRSERKQFIQRTHEDFCRCGEKNEMMFLWRHVKGRAGALHTRSEGEWLVGHTVSDDGWKTKGLEAIPTGPQTIFLGADTENPNFIIDPEGNGFLRTENYAPNSIFGNDKTWGHRDDMKLALECKIDMCPDNLRAGTSIDLQRHASMNP